MKISNGLSEDGVIVGNAYDKYGSSNPVVQHIMRGFDAALTQLVRRAAPSSIHEIGCGEGYWVLRWLKEGLIASGSDFSGPFKIRVGRGKCGPERLSRVNVVEANNKQVVGNVDV